MRRARSLHAECGRTRVGSRRTGGLRLAAALSVLAAIGLILTLAALPALAQDPSLSAGSTKPKSSFPKQPGGMFGPAPKIDQAQPLYLQADQLLYDTKSSRVIALPWPPRDHVKGRTAQVRLAGFGTTKGSQLYCGQADVEEV